VSVPSRKLPNDFEIEQAILAVAAELVVDEEDRLLELAAERLGWPDDDPELEECLEAVEEDLVSGFGPLVWLPGDITVHVPSLCRDKVFTHRLTEAERELDTLTVTFDLSGFAHVPEPTVDGEPIRVEGDDQSMLWRLPAGHLSGYTAGAVIAVRVGPEDAVSLEVLPDEPPVDAGLVRAVRTAYDREVDEPGLPVDGRDLVIGVLVDDRTAFAAPQASLSSLCEAAGLERRGAMVAHDDETWHNEDRVARIIRVGSALDDGELAGDALEVLSTIDDVLAAEAPDPERLRALLDDLDDPVLLEPVAHELFRPGSDPVALDRLTSLLITAANRPIRKAVAHHLAALAAEASGSWVVAEQHLELAIQADPDHEVAADRLAWYVADRGDAARAARLWRRCEPSPLIEQNLAMLERFLGSSGPTLGRNDRCWCGSGRKFKQCHLGAPRPAALPDRVPWLCQKAAAYVQRIGSAPMATIFGVIGAMVSDPTSEQAIAGALGDPLVMDLVLTEGGWFSRFLADRHHLLPDDEALLAAAWETVDRSLHEIVSVAPEGLVLRDLRSGEEVDVTERSLSKAALVGGVLCGRVVPDGVGHQIVGGLFAVTPGREAALLDVLDRGDPEEIAAWRAAAAAPPRLANREGEPLVECTIEIVVAEVDALRAHLSATYTAVDGASSWVEDHDLSDDETIVRGRFDLDGNRLVITTNSHERADRMLERLRPAVRFELVSDERTPLDVATMREREAAGLPPMARLAPDDAPPLDDEALDEIRSQMEERWCREAVPALGGVTPREAAADPTRREALERLLLSFERAPGPPHALTFRVPRLRELLGL
jgi:hypothetical protein